MFMHKGKTGIVVLLILVFIGILIVICKAPELFKKRHIGKIELSQKTYRVIQQYEETIDPKMKSLLSPGGLANLSEEFESRLLRDPKNTWARIQLAIMYKIQNQWRKALEHFMIANTHAPELADPLTGIGLVLYELALFDMTNRNLFKQARSGLPIFMPDQETKALLLESRAFLQKAKQLTFIYRESQGKNIYNFGPDTIDEHLRSINDKLQMQAPPR